MDKQMNMGGIQADNTCELFEQLPHSVFTADLKGTITYWNKASEELFGYTRQEIIKQPLEQFFSASDKHKLHQGLNKLQEGKDVELQWKTATKEGVKLWVQMFGKAILNQHEEPIFILASITEINQLRATEKELKDISNQVETILESTVDGVFNIDERGVVQSFNKSASKIFGYSENEIHGKNYRKLIPEHHKNGAGNLIKKIFSFGQNDYVGSRREITGQRKDGSIFPMEISATKTSYNKKKIITCVVNDISERRRLEQEILWISEEERRSIGQNMHDGLGQILTGVQLISLSLAQKLDEQGIAEADEVQQIADMVKEANEQARALAHGLAHVGIEEEELSTSFRRLGKQVKKLFNIQCTLEIDSDIIINNDVTALNLYRIAQEAINNAYKHGKADKVKIILKQEAGFIHLYIENNGSPFSLSESEVESTGMGVNIMRYRTHMIFGHFDIVTTKEGTTRTCCKVPIEYCHMS